MSDNDLSESDFLEDWDEDMEDEDQPQASSHDDDEAMDEINEEQLVNAAEEDNPNPMGNIFDIHAPLQNLERAPVDIMSLDSMFSRHQRKSPSSLYDLAESRVIRMIIEIVSSRKLFRECKNVFSSMWDQSILPALQTRLLEKMIPTRDKWRFPCVQSRRNIACQAHQECKIVRKFCDRLIRLLFTPKCQRLSVNFRKVRVDNHRGILCEINRVISSTTTSSNLTALVMEGGNFFTDGLLERIEGLCENLVKGAPNLSQVHLPICSNQVLKTISEMSSLIHFKADRTRRFDKAGLFFLCHSKSKSRTNLETIHLGVFKHRFFTKVDAVDFFKKMPELKIFSFLDEDRALANIVDQSGPGFGDKVMTYSVLKMAITDRILAKSTKPFKCGLFEIKIVDRLMKPKYIVESCPDLKKLYIDWQEELSYPAIGMFPPEWFSKMLVEPDWANLMSKLEALEIVFPSSYSPNSYSLPLPDFCQLLKDARRLQQLRLVGAGKSSPILLTQILRQCPNLRRLVLEKTSIHVPVCFEVIDKECISRSLQVFHLLGDMSTLLANGFITHGIANYMPELVELEIQPETVIGYDGLRPEQMHVLTRLKRLEKLSLPLSISACIMNMPEIMYVLRDFRNLRYLTLSWASKCTSYSVNEKRIVFLTQWLFNALGAENANIYLQLCYKMHPDLFEKPI